MDRIKLADVDEIYAKDPQLKKEDVKSLSQWVQSQPHLPELKELQIILFLHSCYYDIEKAQITLENYFKFITTSGLCEDYTEELFKRALSYSFLGFMPKKTPDGDAVVITKLTDPRPEVYNCLDVTKVMIASVILYLHQFGPPNGFIFIGDQKYSSMGHFMKMSFSIMKKSMHFFQEAAPIRIKSGQHVNVLPITETLMSFARPFIKKELYEKLHFYTHSLDGLYKHVPKECLPEDYGGLLPSLEELGEKNLENILKNLEILKWLEKQQIDENKRVKKEKGFFGSWFSGS